MDRYYKHSGKVNPAGIVLGLLAAGVVAIPASYAYDWSLMHIFDERINMIITVLFGVLIGAVAGWGLMLGKVRNNFVAAIVGAIGGAVALYISWGIWLFMIIGPRDEITSPISFLAHPAYMWQVILAVNAHGTWGWKDSSELVTGTELWIFWSLEAAGIIGFGLSLAYLVVNQKPFCEGCGQWCKKIGNVFFATPAPQMQSPDWRNQMIPDPKQLVENKQFDFLGKVTRYTKQGPAGTYAMNLQSCTQCGAFHTLSLTRTSMQRRGAAATLVNKLLITTPEAEFVRRFILPAQGATTAAAGK